MHIMYFTERPYRDVPEDEVIRNRSFFGVPNRFYDAKIGARLYNEYLDEDVYAEEVGFDGVMLNEHHGNPFCMGSVMNVEAAILARITKKVRIVLLGNPLPVVKNPVRLAEELAEIDLISRGRLVSGWVRGAGSEQIFNQANPAYNREYFNEAHDLVMACWTKPVPLGRQALQFPLRQSMGAAISEAPSSHLDSGRDQRRDGGVVRKASLPVHRAGHRAAIDGRIV